MKQFNHIEIHKDNASLMRLVDKMKELKGEDFYYDKDASDLTNARCNSDSVCRDTYYALFKTDLESLYFTTVFVSVKENELKVFQINSSDSRFFDLGITRYNFVIDAFFHHFIARCLDESYTGCVSIAGEVRSLEDELGRDVYKALKAWEQICNKEAPISHPMDEKAWFKFVSKLHRSGKILHPLDFGQWLSEDCHWPSYYSNAIAEMEDRLEYSLLLLNYYDESSNN